ncbi:MAG TPA: hypothetical protein VGO47_06095, partial [Chlamydiales bacterium]|nr:hypothetical protein [Chlamydiales bacterium]
MSAPISPEFSSIMIVIEYTLRHPTDGIQFVIPTEAYSQVSRYGMIAGFIISRNYTAHSSRIYDAFGPR